MSRPEMITGLRLHAEVSHPIGMRVYGVTEVDGVEVEIACSAFRIEHDYNSQSRSRDEGFGPLYAWVRVRLHKAEIGAGKA